MGEGGIFSLNPKTLFKFKLLKIPIFWPIIFQRKGWWWWSIIWEIFQIIHNFLMNTFLLSKDDKELRYRDAPLIIIFRKTMTSQDDILDISSDGCGVYCWPDHKMQILRLHQLSEKYCTWCCQALLSLTKMSKFHTLATSNISRLRNLVYIFCFTYAIIAVWCPWL